MLVLLLIVGVVLAQDYCNNNQRHTLCLADKGPGPKCNGQHLDRGITTAEREEILEVHNRYRAKIARGEERRGQPGPQPGAADMKQMTWDPELARVAQTHADQCVFAHDCADCRKVQRFGVGQNLYIYKQSLRRPANDWEKGITDWYDEVALFSNKHVEPFQFSSPTGHYTALVWANTDKVGCGATSYRDGKWFATLYTCNYGPTGNYIRGQMYKAGPACSVCPGRTVCSRSYPGLCMSPSNEPLFFNSTISTPPKTPAAVKNTIQAPLSKPVNRPGRPQSPLTQLLADLTTRRPTRRPTKPTTRRPTTTTRRTTTTTTRRPTTTTTRKPTTTTTRRSTTTTTRRPTTTTTRRPTTTTTRRPTRPSTRRTPKRPTTTTTTTERPTRRPRTTARNRFQPTTVRTSRTNSSPLISRETLFSCKFEPNESSCRTRKTGKLWENKQVFGNHFSQLLLETSEKTEFFFQQLINPPTGGLACLDFRYKKISSGGSKSILTVFAWPRNGRPGRVSVAQNSPDQFTWVRAQVTFRNVEDQFLIMFRGTNTARGESLLLAVDDVTVTAGTCARAQPRA